MDRPDDTNAGASLDPTSDHRGAAQLHMMQKHSIYDENYDAKISSRKFSI